MRNLNLIDVHNHILFDVDDGAQTIEASLEMIKYAKDHGVTTCVLTPHLFSRASKASRAKHIKHFEYLLRVTKDWGMTLILGGEIKYKSHMDINYDLYAIGPMKTILLEFSTFGDTAIDDICYNLIRKGYQVIVAHVERYSSYTTLEGYKRIKETGAYLQVNATSIIGYEDHKNKKLIKNLLKHRLVDIIATDAHDMAERKPDLLTSYEFLEKKLDADYLEALFHGNASKLLFK